MKTTRYLASIKSYAWLIMETIFGQSYPTQTVILTQTQLSPVQTQKATLAQEVVDLSSGQATRARLAPDAL